ncbi:MAG: recombinase family protein [Bacteroidetes bacterium]|nr:recombinase family protein [Bacteroidota bacterium]
MDGTKEKLINGIWCTRPPRGYDTVKRNGERFIEINDTGKLLRKAFLWKAQEQLTHSEIVKRLASSGLKITIKTLHAVFTNPFYCGMLSHSALGGELIKGKHEPLVSQEIFLKVNDIKPRNYGKLKNEKYANTPLKGLLKCESCGELMRGYIVKKKGLYYYKCNSDKKCGCNKSAKDLHNQFQGILEELTIEEKYVEVFKDQLRHIYTELNANKDKANAEFQRQLNEVETKLERLEERFINEEIKPDLYEKFAKKFRQEKQAIEENMKGCPVSGSNLEYFINRSVEISTELPSLWASSDYSNKQKLQNLIFPEGIYYNKKKDESRTTKVNSVFLQIARLKRVSGENEKGLQAEKPLKSLWVASPRIELGSKV